MPNKDPEKSRLNATTWREANREWVRKRGRVWYAKNLEKIRVTGSTQKRIQYKVCKAAWLEVIRLLGKDRCLRCGYNKCFAAIDFHHRDPQQKELGIARMFGRPVTEKRLVELEKCDALCSNCHRELHYGD